MGLLEAVQDVLFSTQTVVVILKRLPSKLRISHGVFASMTLMFEFYLDSSIIKASKATL